MASNEADILSKLKWSLPWLLRYPLWRAGKLLEPGTTGPTHVIFVVANHFEPGVGKQAAAPVDHWCKIAQSTGRSVVDHDGTFFRHTYFFPAEQYDYASIEKLCALEEAGLGEVEVHLHHGVDKPDNASNTRHALETFRDTLAYEHRCLSRDTSSSSPRYAFVHGNLALANSAGGRYCGVDSEMEILASTGCYADFTLPSAPEQSQVPKINAIYQCGHPLEQARPHRSGPDLKVGDKPNLPIIVTGPLVFDWTRRVRGLPIPRMDDGALAGNYPLKMARFRRWQSAQIGIKGRPEWIFIKLHCHAFFEQDQDAMMGDELRRFMTEIVELGDATGRFRVHFATAREVFNIILAALEGKQGDPAQYREYSLRPIRKESPVRELKEATTMRPDMLEERVS
ncbi:MAG TPA: hypothetical protein VF088_13390 [Pyrinomonadaceae bacterium]